MTRNEHIAWCKERALEYVESGDLTNAWASMVTDLSTHDGTQGHVGIQLGMMQIMTGGLKTQHEMRHFIEGFN